MAQRASRTDELPEDIAGVFRLNGQRALVTGTASGLGKAIALGFAHFGADVACLDIDLEGARETASAIAQMGRESTAIEVDVRDWESVRASAEEARSWAGRVDVAVTLPPGRYDATWVSPVSGEPAPRERIDHAGGTRTLRSPAFTADVALKIVRDAPPSAR